MRGVQEYLRNNRLPKHSSFNKSVKSLKLLFSLDTDFHVLVQLLEQDFLCCFVCVPLLLYPLPISLEQFTTYYLPVSVFLSFSAILQSK